MKPIYKISIIAVIVVLIGVGVYFGWRALTQTPSTSLPPAGGSQTKEPGVTGAGLSLKKLSDDQIFNFWILPDTNAVVYLAPDGRFFEAVAGDDTLLSNQTVNALNEAVMSPDNQKILTSFGDPRQPQWGIFDLVDKIWRPLPPEILKITWAGNSEKLVGFTAGQNQTNLSLIDITKNPPAVSKIIDNLNLADVKLTWQEPNQLLFIEKPSAFYAGRVWTLNINTKELKQLFGPTEGLTASFFEKTKTFLITSNAATALQITTATVSDSFFKTLPEKCAVTETDVYCFVPFDVPSSVKMPDDYFMKKFYPIDGLYSFNIQSGQTRKLFTSDAPPFPAVDGIYPQYQNGKIYFLNRYDGFLYELTL